MDDFNEISSFFEQGIKLVAYCPLCDTNLKTVKAKVIGGKDDLELVHFQCYKCYTNIMVLVLPTVSGLNSMGLITDLNYADAVLFRQKLALECDQVINMHNFFSQPNLTSKIKELINTNK